MILDDDSSGLGAVPVTWKPTAPNFYKPPAASVAPYVSPSMSLGKKLAIAGVVGALGFAAYKVVKHHGKRASS